MAAMAMRAISVPFVMSIISVAHTSELENGCDSETACVANSMLQMSGRLKTESRLDTGRGNLEGNLYTKTGRAVPMIKKTFDSFPAEFLFIFSAETKGMSVNETHITIATDLNVQSNYIKRLRGLEDEEVGVALQAFGGQMSMFGDAFRVGIMEKLHGFYRKKPIRTESVERARNYTAPAGAVHDPLRRFGLDIAATLAEQYPTQGRFLAGLPSAEIAEFARDGGTVPTDFASRSREAADIMRKHIREMPDSRLADPLVSLTNCMHFEAGSFTEDAVTFPLNTKMHTLRFHAESAPATSYDGFQGVSVWTHHPRDGTIELYYGAALQSHMPYPEAEDSDDFPEGKIIAGPASGAGSPITVEGFNPLGMSEKAFALNQMALQFAKDYTFLWQEPAKLCTSQVKTQIAALIPLVTSVQQKTLNKEAWSDDETKGFVNYATLLLQCATAYLRPDHIHGVDASHVALASHLHLALEVPPKHQLLVYGLEWNQYDLSLVRSNSTSDACEAGFALELHSCEPNHGDVCRKHDGSGRWKPPSGCTRFGGKPPFSVKDDGSDMPCRVDVPAAGCRDGFSYECGSLAHGDVCRRDDDSGHWSPPQGCERVMGGGPPWSVFTGTSDPCLGTSAECEDGFNFEAGELPHGDVCRSNDGSGNWHPPTGCEKSTPSGQFPFSVEVGTQRPCRIFERR